MHFHVVNKGSAITDDNVPDSQINDQIRVLNDAYGGVTGGADTPFRFVLARVDRTTNSSWFNVTLGSEAECQMKSALRQGGAETLNIYTADMRPLGRFGWATFPYDYAANPINDGVVILYSALPGGSATPNDKGDTAVHEVGHWLGLYHTFQGGCSARNDRVDDTPAELDWWQILSFFCTRRDTCLFRPGLDPVENFMNYTDDECTSKFTSGQASRAGDFWMAYRQTAIESLAPLPTARAWFGGVALEDTIFTIGGGRCNGCANFGGSEVPTVETYQATAMTWSTKAPLRLDRFGLATSEVNGNIYAIGGATSNSGSTPLPDVEEYSLLNDTWSKKMSMLTPRWELTSATVSGKIYAIGGGATGNQCTPTGAVEQYPSSNLWLGGRTSTPTARWGAASAVVNGLIYVIGGSRECPHIIVNPTAAIEAKDRDRWREDNLRSHIRPLGFKAADANRSLGFSGCPSKRQDLCDRWMGSHHSNRACHGGGIRSCNEQVDNKAPDANSKNWPDRCDRQPKDLCDRRL